VESIPLRNCFLSVSFFVLTVPDRNCHRRLAALELRVISIAQGVFASHPLSIFVQTTLYLL